MKEGDYMSELNLVEVIHKPTVSVNFDISPYQKHELTKLAKATHQSKVFHFRKALAEYLMKPENAKLITEHLKEILESVEEEIDKELPIVYGEMTESD